MNVNNLLFECSIHIHGYSCRTINNRIINKKVSALEERAGEAYCATNIKPLRCSDLAAADECQGQPSEEDLEARLAELTSDLNMNKY